MSSEDGEGDSAKVPFEAALDKAGFGLYSFLLTAHAGITIVSFACVVYGSTFIVPSSACELETTETQRGMLAAGPVIGIIVGAALWGYLGDMRGRRSMLLVSLASAAAVNLLASISVNWIMLLTVQLIASILASGQYSLAMTILSESVPMARRSLVVLLVTSIFLLSQGIMALLALPIVPLTFSYHVPGLDIQWNSWRTLMIVYCLPSIIAFVWLLFMQESPKFVFAKGDEEGALNILKIIHRMNNRRSREELQVKGLQLQSPAANAPTAKQQISPLFRQPLLKYFIIMTTLAIFLQIGPFVIWLPTIADQFVDMLRHGEVYDLNLCGIIRLSQDHPPSTDCSINFEALMIVFLTGTLHSLVNGVISLFVDRAGRRNTAIGVASICGVSGIIVNLVPNAIGSVVLFMVFTVGMLLVGLYTAISVALFPTHLRALAISLTMTGGRIVVFAVIQVLNFLLTSNCELGFYIFCSLVALSAVVASFLPDDRKFNKHTNLQETTENKEEDP